jgi:hypothetical protein
MIQRYILRVRRPSTAAYPACWAMGTRLDQPRQNKNLLYRYGKPNEPTKEGSLSIVLFESPFTSVSAVSRAHPSLVSLLLIPLPNTTRSPLSKLLVTLNSTFEFFSGWNVHQLPEVLGYLRRVGEPANWRTGQPGSLLHSWLPHYLPPSPPLLLSDHFPSSQQFSPVAGHLKGSWLLLLPVRSWEHF